MMMYVNQHPKTAESMDASFAASTSMCLITLDSLVGPAFHSALVVEGNAMITQLTIKIKDLGSLSERNAAI